MEYRLCPEYQLPSSINDAVVLYRVLLRTSVLPSQMLIMDDSALDSLSLLSIQTIIERFPAMYIKVDIVEMLEDDSRRVLKKAQEAGVVVTFEEGLHIMYVYPIFFISYHDIEKNWTINFNSYSSNIKLFLNLDSALTRCLYRYVETAQNILIYVGRILLND